MFAILVDITGWNRADKVLLGSNGIYYCQKLIKLLNEKCSQEDKESGQFETDITFLNKMEDFYTSLKIDDDCKWSPMTEDLTEWLPMIEE